LRQDFSAGLAVALADLRDRPSITILSIDTIREHHFEKPAGAVLSGRLVLRHLYVRLDRRPKGAMVEHGGMLNHLYAKIDDLRLTADRYDRLKPRRSAFDISVYGSTWRRLLVGGRVARL